MSAWLAWLPLVISVVSLALSLYAYRLNRVHRKTPKDGTR